MPLPCVQAFGECGLQSSERRAGARDASNSGGLAKGVRPNARRLRGRWSQPKRLRAPSRPPVADRAGRREEIETRSPTRGDGSPNRVGLASGCEALGERVRALRGLPASGSYLHPGPRPAPASCRTDPVHHRDLDRRLDPSFQGDLNGSSRQGAKSRSREVGSGAEPAGQGLSVVEHQIGSFVVRTSVVRRSSRPSGLRDFA